MLNIIFGDSEKSIYDTDTYFNNTYEDDWITSDESVRIIKDIDKSDVKGPNCIESPYLGQISPERLSGGTKTLLLISNDRSGYIFNASACGDNCSKWILELSKTKDITITLYHNMDFGDNFKAKILNNNTIVTSMEEMIRASSDYI